MEACQCPWGFQDVVGACEACPADTFRAVGSPPLCVVCASGSSTFGAVGSVGCACVSGTYGSDCAVCPAGAFCPAGASAPLPCFAGAVSEAGSSECGCLNGTARLLRRSGEAYCESLPVGGVVVDGRLGCLPGWTLVVEAECHLCAAGSYAVTYSDGSLALSAGSAALCQPCPVGTYSDSVMRVGGCTRCPPQQTTPGAGAVSISECVCEAPLTKDAVSGGCVGCSGSEYRTASGCEACPAYSVGDGVGCLCSAGYELRGDACVPCPLNTFSPVASNALCIPCSVLGATGAPVGSTSALACTECLPGLSWRFQRWCS